MSSGTDLFSLLGSVVGGFALERELAVLRRLGVEGALARSSKPYVTGGDWLSAVA